MQDEDEEVRDWATFGLGTQGTSDSPEIRQALLQRLNDPSQDVQEEAMSGLCRRLDERVLPALTESLQNQTVSHCVIDAATDMLEFEAHRENWDAADYLAALRTRFKY